jgi:hypothetical protein
MVWNGENKKLEKRTGRNNEGKSDKTTDARTERERERERERRPRKRRNRQGMKMETKVERKRARKTWMQRRDGSTRTRERGRR